LEAQLTAISGSKKRRADPEAGQNDFTAFDMKGHVDATNDLREGSRLLITGICLIEGCRRKAQAFKIRLRSAADVVAIQRHPGGPVIALIGSGTAALRPLSP